MSSISDLCNSSCRFNIRNSVFCCSMDRLCKIKSFLCIFRALKKPTNAAKETRTPMPANKVFREPYKSPDCPALANSASCRNSRNVLRSHGKITHKSTSAMDAGTSHHQRFQKLDSFSTLVIFSFILSIICGIWLTCGISYKKIFNSCWQSFLFILTHNTWRIPRAACELLL